MAVPVDGREVSNVVPFAILAYLRRGGSEEVVQRALDRAGKQPSLAELEDPDAWSSLEQTRELFHAAAEVAGDPDLPRKVGIDLYLRPRQPEVLDRLRSLGQPSSMMRYISEAAFRQSRVHELRCLEVHRRDALLSARVLPPFPPSEVFCEYIRGAIQAVPTIFGMDLADVTEVECQRHGAERCLYHARWGPVDEGVLQAEAEMLDRRLEALTTSFEALEEIAAELDSVRGRGTALQAIAQHAARAVRAERLMLAVRLPGEGAPRIHSVGFPADCVETHAASLLAEPEGEASPLGDRARLAVDVTSAAHHFGRIAAYGPQAGRFLPEEARLLRAYAGQAAAALEATVAVGEAEERAETMNVLLGLATELAEVTTREEVARRLAHAMHSVASCDEVSVWLWDVTTKVLTCAGRSWRASRDDSPDYHPVPTVITDAADTIGRMTELASAVPVSPAIEDPTLRQIWAVTSTGEGLVMPITAQGECFGLLALGPTSDGTDPEPVALRERLSGVAGLASTAFHNARLLDEIRHQALHDALTGLPNRALVLDRVERALSRGGHPVAVLFLDLDGFKEVNDTFGHFVGDELLELVGGRLANSVRHTSTVGRLGGDEFVVLVEEDTRGASLEALAERLLDTLRQPFPITRLHGLPLTVSASVGIAPGPRSSAEELLRDADVALYEAKAAGKDRAVTFVPAMHRAVQGRLRLEMALRAAIADGQFFLAYQPVVDLTSGEVIAVEALIRWRRPDEGVVPPDDFIGALEDTGLIVPVGRWVLREACRQLAEWDQRGYHLTVGVNLSARQLEQESLVDEVFSVIRENELEPFRLVLELTETSLASNPESMSQRLQALRSLGVPVAVDDFGTGYSSLAYLRQFPVDTLKIDRSFVGAIATSRPQRALVRTMVHLGRELGLRVTAEGIEEYGQLEYLRSVGCHAGQGHLFAPALEPAEVERFLDAQVGQDSTPSTGA